MSQMKKILIADDEVEVTELLSNRLTEKGFEVILANNGKSALELIRRSKPDLILMDIVMPDLDGSEVVSALKADAGGDETPIIFLSGIIDKDEEADAPLEVQVAGHAYPAIAKPFVFEELYERVKTVLR